MSISKCPIKSTIKSTIQSTSKKPSRAPSITFNQHQGQPSHGHPSSRISISKVHHHQGQSLCRRFCSLPVTSKGDISHQQRNQRKLKKEARREEKLANRQKNVQKKKNKELVFYEGQTKPGEKKDTACEMPDKYHPQYIEAAWYDWWHEQGYFLPKPHRVSENNDKTFVVCLPPPNVTGQLHLGHALGNSIQDAIVRWHRMRGYKVLWNPGMDHAGIATQVRVEKQLWMEEGKTRHDIGRDAFVEKVWQWKNEKGSRIFDQMRKLGSSLDWSRNCFTLDPKMCRAVNEAFIRLFDEGLIYRNKRLVNWSCALKSTISDLEVDRVDVEGRTRLAVPGYDNKVMFGVMTDFAFPVLGQDAEIVVSTTRPETLLGDTGVAVHPADSRYSAYHGLHVQHPFCDRTLPIVCDEHVDPDFGTGAVKITPGHDVNDFNIGLRHNLPSIDILDDEGTLVNVPEPFLGMPRFKARGAVIQALKEKALHRGERTHSMSIPLCSRSGDVIEPRLKDQWYVDCRHMTQRTRQAVEEGRLELIPGEAYTKVWNEWLEGDATQDWCISRQLWWGHRVPAFQVYRKASREVDIDFYKGRKPAGWVSAHDQISATRKACDWLKCSADDIDVIQDEDVLDTWFSSGLFPFAIFGWPDQTADLKEFYPTHLLETASDIMFFWVARMVMLGEKLTGQLPFNKVLFHGILRDWHGRKMSKSLGNVIDPMHVIHGISLEDLHKSLEKENFEEAEKKKAREGQVKDFPVGIPECGTDALRFTMCDHRYKAHFLNINIEQLQKNRYLCSKIWQSNRFILKTLHDNGVSPYSPQHLAQHSELSATDQWALSTVSHLVHTCHTAFTSHDLFRATDAINSYWRDLSAVYLEYIKVILKDHNDTRGIVTKQVLHMCTDAGLRAMSPFMPYLAEEIYQRLPENPSCPKTESVTIAAYPDPSEFIWLNKKLLEDVQIVRKYGEFFTSVRNQLKMKKLKHGEQQDVYLKIQDSDTLQILQEHQIALTAMSGFTDIQFQWDTAQTDRCLQMQTESGDIAYITLNGLMDVEKRLEELEKEIESLNKTKSKISQLLDSRKLSETVASLEGEKLAMTETTISKCETLFHALSKLK